MVQVPNTADVTPCHVTYVDHRYVLRSGRLIAQLIADVPLVYKIHISTIWPLCKLLRRSIRLIYAQIALGGEIASIMSTQSLRQYSCLTFDCYGTLVDWEHGFIEAFRPLTDRLDQSHPFRQDPATLLKRYGHHEPVIQAQHPTLRYFKILEKVYQAIANECDLDTEITEEEKISFGASIGTWKTYPDTVEALKRLAKYFKLVVLSNVDKESFDRTLSGPLRGAAFSAVYIAEDIGCYKPDLRNFEYLIEHCRTELGIDKHKILHTAYSLPADLKPAKDIGLKGCLINRYPNAMGGDLEQMKDHVAVDFRFETLRDMADAADVAFSS